MFRQSDFIELAIGNLTQALVLGFLLVVVIVSLFLFEWRAALISLVTIPLSLVATLLVLHWRGTTINTMTLAGLVIALGAVSTTPSSTWRTSSGGCGRNGPVAAPGPTARGGPRGIPRGPLRRSSTPRSSSSWRPCPCSSSTA